MDNKTENKKTKSNALIKALGSIKGTFCDRTVVSGLYSFLTIVIVIGIAVIFNMIVGRLELKGDLTDDKLYSITDDTIDLISELDDNITIYYLTTSAEKDESIYELVSKYEKYGKNIKIELKDVDVYPKFFEQYTDEVTSDTFVSNSVVVVNNDKKDAYKFISNSDMVIKDYDYQTYSVNSISIDVEGQITSAINYVTSDSTNKMYFVTGHGETESFGSVIGGLIDKKNFETKTINLATNSEIPEDCSLLTLYAPTVDISEEELEIIKNYLDAGNEMLIIFGYGQNNMSMTNFNSLLNYYCLKQVDGLTIEKSTDNYMSNGSQDLLIPNISTSHDITSGIGSVKAVFPASVGLTTTSEVSDYITVTDLVSTSDMSYAMTDTTLDVSKITSKNSEVGPFMLGAAVEKKYNDVTSKLVVFSSASAFNEKNFGNYITNLSNPDLILNSVSWLCNLDEQSTIAIDVKTDNTSQLVINAKDINKWFAIVTLIVPAIILVGGLFVWARRRKR